MLGATTSQEAAQGSAQLLLKNGTMWLTNRAGDTMVGRNPGYKATLVVDGQDAAIRIARTLHGSGQLVVSNGATLEADMVTMELGTNHSAGITVSGQGSFLGTFISMDDGVILVEDGGHLSSGKSHRNGGWLGGEQGRNAISTIRGTGSAWDGLEQLAVGGSGYGRLEVLDGGTVRSAWTLIGNRIGSEGEVILSGEGSYWTNGTGLRVGDYGEGFLKLQEGALLDTGSITVSYGSNSVGTLVVCRAAKLNCHAGWVGQRPGSDGQAEVRGERTEWSLSDILAIGADGSDPGGAGRLTVTDGGLVTVGKTLFVGEGAVLATVTIDGIWTLLRGRILVGQADPVSITNSGLYVGPGGKVQGWGTYFGDTVVNGGCLEPHAADGTMVFSNTLAFSGDLRLRLKRTQTPANSRIIANHLLCRGGTLTVENVGEPLVAGDTFNLLQFSSMEGAFQQINLPVLGTGLYWDTTELYTNGVITVVGPRLSGHLVVDSLGNRVFELRVTYPHPANVGIESAAFLASGEAWVPLLVHHFDAQNPTFQIQVGLNSPSRFFRLRVLAP